MKQRLRLAVMAGAAALVIAFFLRDVVEQVLVGPIMYLVWLLGIFYRFVPQPVLWLLAVVGMAYLLLVRLAGRIRLNGKGAPPAVAALGPVDDLARRIEAQGKGIYFKWQIAHKLGRMAADLQELRMRIRGRKLDLERTDAAPQVRRYLEAGLNTSFSDYPIPGWLSIILKREAPRSTPFDTEIGPVIDFLESEMENVHGLRRT